MDSAKNFAKVTVSTGYDASATSIVLSSGHGAKLPTAPFNAVWWNATDYADPSDDPNVEIVRVIAISTDTLTVTRAQESTSASTKNTASKTYKMVAGITAKFTNTDLANIPLNAPRGFLINGKLSITVASNNITVAVKTLAGNDPSAADPVYCRIGDTVRSITAALSVTKNAGTNWFNSGSSELATQEIDYFAYLGYNATDGVVIGFARIPYARKYSDFSTTTTSEKYCAISTITTAAADDFYEVVGRFGATLSATASFNWSVPTFTAINLVQRPIYDTRWLIITGVYTGFSSNPTGETYRYKLVNDVVHLLYISTGDGTSNATTFTVLAPFQGNTNMPTQIGIAQVRDNTAVVTTACRARIQASTNSIDLYTNFELGVWTNSGGKRASQFTIIYRAP